MSLANASVCLTDAWAFHHNPGAIAGIKQTSIGLSYENRFTLKELQNQALVIAHPLKKGVISLGAQTYGFSLYRIKLDLVMRCNYLKSYTQAFS